MESALIVSNAEKSVAFLSDTLRAAFFDHIEVRPSCGEARRLILERGFDLVVINAPLRDESGENLAKHIVAKGNSQVILIVKSELFEEVSSVCEDIGVLTLAKPMNKSVFWSSLKLAKAAQNRLRRLRDENSKLNQKIADIRIVDRAKCLLISHMKMSEGEAHRYIEKHAMDMRLTKRDVAEGILKTYES